MAEPYLAESPRLSGATRRAANILTELLDGRAYTAASLASVAWLDAHTTSVHLAKLGRPPARRGCIRASTPLYAARRGIASGRTPVARFALRLASSIVRRAAASPEVENCAVPRCV